MNIYLILSILCSQSELFENKEKYQNTSILYTKGTLHPIINTMYISNKVSNTKGTLYPIITPELFAVSALSALMSAYIFMCV